MAGISGGECIRFWDVKLLHLCSLGMLGRLVDWGSDSHYLHLVFSHFARKNPGMTSRQTISVKGCSETC